MTQQQSTRFDTAAWVRQGADVARSLLVQRGTVRADADTVFLEHELRRTLGRVWEDSHRDYNFRSLLPINREIGDTDKSFYAVRESIRGEAKVMDLGASDPPRVTASRYGETYPVVSVATSWDYTEDDLAASVLHGKPLSIIDARAARLYVDKQLHSLAISGDSGRNVLGFVNQSGVPNVAATTGTWTSATPDEIAKDVADGRFRVRTQSSYAEPLPNTCALPPSKLHLLRTTRLTDNGTTLLDFVQRANPGLEFVELIECVGTGTGTTDQMILYTNDAMYVETYLVRDFTPLPPQQRNWSFVVNVSAKSGGTVFHKPYSAVQIYGI